MKKLNIITYPEVDRHAETCWTVYNSNVFIFIKRAFLVVLYDKIGAHSKLLCIPSNPRTHLS
jgi:hypothetical protein